MAFTKLTTNESEVRKLFQDADLDGEGKLYATRVAVEDGYLTCSGWYLNFRRMFLAL